MRPIDVDEYVKEMKRREYIAEVGMTDAVDPNLDHEIFTEREYWNGVLGTFTEAIDVAENMPTIGGWISVEDRMPEKDGLYIVYGCTEAMKELLPDCVPIWLCYYYKAKGEWHEFNGDISYDFITHWMPLPIPPEEDEKHGR